MPPEIERLYLDFDSFFATAEQHFNPALRARPVGVVPLDSPHSGCIAISREAKALGVKGNTSIKDAQKIIPDMIFVVARHDVYVRLHHRIINVIETCLPVSHVRSIDEVVCNLLPSEAAEKGALVARLKGALAAAFSDVLTCSIGMAPTELLAKIGAEMNKPNGFVCLEKCNLPDQLNHLDLKDIPGISEGMARRLDENGVYDFQSLWDLAPKQARAIWGSVEGERFWNELHGYHAQKAETVKRMFGHSRMLPSHWQTPDKVRDCAQQLTTSATRRLRRADLRASKLTLSLRGRGHRGKTARNKAGRGKDDLRWKWEMHCPPARDDHTFLTLLYKGLATAEREVRFKPRSVSVMLHGLFRDCEVIEDLFGNQPDGVGQRTPKEQQQRWECLSDVMDQLRSTHGPEVISLGPRRDIPGGYLGAKIAFGRIPDVADFSHDPVADEATHFCKTL